MPSARLIALHLVAEQKMFWRNPPAAVFTFVFPLIFLAIFPSLMAGEVVGAPGREMPFIQYFLPNLAAFGVITACFTNLAIFLCTRRERGILKRKRGTPAPAGVLIGGLVGSVLVVAFVLVVVITVAGVLFNDVTFPGRYAALALYVAAGAFCFCTLGIAVSAFIPNETAAPAMSQAMLYPALFISGTFIPVPTDSVLHKVAGVLPVRHFNDGMLATFDPFGDGHGIVWRHVGALVLWGLIGTAVARWRFRWEPVGRR
ncbi:MAG: ABC transporter permease [Acidimicrobiia bacterium]